MEAYQYLEAYGFLHIGKVWVKSGPDGRERTKYMETTGGFLRWEREDGEWRAYPYTIHADWAGISGLAFDEKQARLGGGGSVKPDCFNWVYPQSEIERTYGAVREPAREK